jgi:GMP synthase (glutamine-hydrolysing)
MRNILVFQHVAHEILGTLHPLLKQAGSRIRYANFGRYPDLAVNSQNYDGLVILGGPMGVYEADRYPHLNTEIACIKEFIADDKPILGICLGAQLVAAALGASVAPAQEQEVGWYDVNLTEEGAKDPVLGAMKASEKIFQWHGDAFQLPDGAQWLATSNACPYQAFRWGSKTYGFQFHLEVDEKMIHRWLDLPAHANLFVGENGKLRQEEIRTETARYIQASKELSTRVFRGYINTVNARSKLRHKP